jgi:sterol desaturase/sphingolipid hydroxylase (fatty acid hydroxylase superfamily)
MIDTWITTNANDVQFVLFFVLFILFAGAEVVTPRRPGPMHRRTRWVTNLLTTLNVVVLSLLPVTFFRIAVWARERDLGLLNAVALPLGVMVVANLLARGFISFFTHFLMHKVPVLWRVHRVHHLDTELDVTTTVRFHPVEFLVALVPGAALIVTLGLSPWVLLFYEILDAAITLFSHANVRVPAAVDRVLRYVIVTPDLHRVHHSAWQTETDSNFSAVFPIWDIAFRTFRTATREPQESMTLGLEEVRDDRAQRLGWLLASPLHARLEPSATTAPPEAATSYDDAPRVRGAA